MFFYLENNFSEFPGARDKMGRRTTNNVTLSDSYVLVMALSALQELLT